MSDTPDRPSDLSRIFDEFLARRQRGESSSLDEYCQRFPDLAEQLRQHVRLYDALGDAGSEMDVPGSMKDLDYPVAPTLKDLKSAIEFVPSEEQPRRIGRYRIERVLGKGGFGLVYLAYDDQLQRVVVIKVPHRERAERPEDAQACLTEARTVANLDHPNIVPVYDVGSTEQFPCYVVSKFIDGTDLAQRLRQARLPTDEIVKLVATVAEALHHAHTPPQLVVHRDVKPGNIMLDRNGEPFVTDFGLALREQDIGKGPRCAGTPAYMSPEQAHGEGHRVDGRSDIFSLGVVFYEMLTGRLPFQGESPSELLEQISNALVRPPRQIDDTIPNELDRICLKALAKRASDRYATARDMAEDLRDWLSPASADRSTPTLDGHPIKIVPKGLRSFDAQDADFFLYLLPGPRDRQGQPDSIRFWKTRIETQGAVTFSVGLIYGPSGCGKSSLIRAGLLPRLANFVTSVYVGATGEETEARLLAGLRRQLADLPTDLGLIESLAALRQGRFIKEGQKVLLVLDQFEQWLHSKHHDEHNKLVQALRQCDGERVQSIVLVRDDFGMAATRFMAALDLSIVQGNNFATVDLFDLRHARKVLTAFGRAFAALPEHDHELTTEQNAFLDQAVSSLSQENKVISVRLALFAEMVKGKKWVPATLKEIGGTEGVGVTFLEDTFASRSANPQHRLHQKAAQAVLKSLLPDAGTDIKGHMRSQQQVLEASGYVNRPKDFEELLRILDGEIRLITPTDPEDMLTGRASDGSVHPSLANEGTRYYQLTHDYLVPSLRNWLTRKQKETRRGQAELLLADRAAVWNTRPENRQLPSVVQWLQIKWLTARKHWTPPQRKMMRQAARYHLGRGLVVTVVLALLGWGGYEAQGMLKAHALRDRLLDADTADVPTIVGEMTPYRRWVDPLLRDAAKEADANKDPRKQLHVSLALVPVDPGQVDFLYGRLLTVEPQEVTAIRAQLRPHADSLVERLWVVLQDRTADSGRRLRAAAALAVFAPDDPRWAGVNGHVAAMLAAENAFVVARWAEALRPVRRSLVPPLADLLLAEGRDATQRRAVTNLYADYAVDQPEAYARLEQILTEESQPDAVLADKLALARRQANAAVVLAALGRWEKVQPLLRHRPDPTLRSYVIDRLGPGGVEAKAIMALLGPEQEVSLRRASISALGEYGQDGVPLPEREVWGPQLLKWYRNDPDPGVHGALGWLLRRWGQQVKVEEIDKACQGHPPAEGRRWYVNAKGLTMVLVPPGEFSMGEGKERVQRRIEYTFALAAHEVSIVEYRRFREKHQYPKPWAPTEDCPVITVSWYDAAAYCNWLSKEDGIPEDQWCYVKNDKGEYADGLKVPADYLRRTGYRLPNEAEWEYACRAGSVTSWPHGAAEDLLGKYAWFNLNSTSKCHPGGELRPNEFGLFDMCGNAWELCQNRFDELGHVKQKDDKEDIVDSKRSRASRGGSFDYNPRLVRSVARASIGPGDGLIEFGFRPARTLR